MRTWPDIEPCEFGMEEEVYLPQVRTQFEGGYVQSRKRATVDKERFAQKWGYSKPETAMPEADFQTLKTFFLANQGSSFDWTHPYVGTSHTCRFTADGLKSAIIAPGLRKVDCPIEEV